MKFNTKFLQITCLGALFIGYRNLNCIWYDFPRRRPDGSCGCPDGQLCNWLSKFAWNSFLNRAVSGRCCPSVQTVALLLHAISILRPERLDHGVWRSDGWTSSARLALTRIVSGRNSHVVWMVATVFPYLCFGKKIF
jgi:hypothetical protein